MGGGDQVFAEAGFEGERLDLTDAQKRDKRFYPAKAVIVFNRETKDFAKGEWLVTISRGTQAVKIRAVKIFTQDKAQLRENVGRLGDRELAIEFAKQDSAQARRVPPPVRKYIAGLIQGRRPQTAQQKNEKIDLWKHKQTHRMTPQRTHGRRT